MATLTIRNLPDEVRDLLRREAAQHNRSMEEEARQTLAERYRPRASADEILRRLNSLNAKYPSLPSDAKMDGTEAFLAEKRINSLFEEGAISLKEKKRWDERIERYSVSLPEVQAFFEKHWPWQSKRS